MSTNIVNGFDDSSVRHEDSPDENSPENSGNFMSNRDSLKSRNINSFSKKFQQHDIRSLISMKENIPQNQSMFQTKNWTQNTVENIDSNSSFSMNQNHLHLHVNVTNAPGFGQIEKSRIASKRAQHSYSAFEKSNRIDSSRDQFIDKEKVKLKRNNIQYGANKK